MSVYTEGSGLSLAPLRSLVSSPLISVCRSVARATTRGRDVKLSSIKGVWSKEYAPLRVRPEYGVLEYAPLGATGEYGVLEYAPSGEYKYWSTTPHSLPFFSSFGNFHTKTWYFIRFFLRDAATRRTYLL